MTPQDLHTYLTSIGATPNEAAMLTSAAGAESHWNPTLTHDGGIGYGLWGHNGDRLAAMQSQGGSNTPSWQAQAKYALSEIQSNPRLSSMVNAAQTPQQLTVAQMHYERPLGYTPQNPTAGDNYSGRLAITNQVMNGGVGGLQGSAPSGLSPADQAEYARYQAFKTSGPGSAPGLAPEDAADFARYQAFKSGTPPQGGPLSAGMGPNSNLGKLVASIKSGIAGLAQPQQAAPAATPDASTPSTALPTGDNIPVPPARPADLQQQPDQVPTPPPRPADLASAAPSAPPPVASLLSSIFGGQASA